MKVPLFDVVLSDGSTVPLRSLYEDRPLCLVFLRHLGCIFCREHVAELREAKDLNIAFVSMSAAPEVDRFRKEAGSPHPFISDSARALFEVFGLRRASLGQVFSPKVFGKGARAWSKGVRSSRPPTDPWQLGGTFVIDTDGEVVWERRSEDVADNATVEEIRLALAKAAKPVVA